MVAARGVGRRIRLAWLGKRTRLTWLGSQRRRLHKEEAPDRSLVPISNSTHSSVQTLAVKCKNHSRSFFRCSGFSESVWYIAMVSKKEWDANTCVNCNCRWQSSCLTTYIQYLGGGPFDHKCREIAYPRATSKEVEWEMFLKHLVDRRVYIIEDWESTQSTIQNLMYDHGIKQPDDGTDVPFYKGECDASYDARTKTASLSYMIWKDDKVIYAEAFSGLTFPSATEAEIYAAFALLYKAEELGIHKLYLCSDSRTVTEILTGELPISMNYQHRDLYLTLRSTRFLFKWLIVTWKPRELMFYMDSLSNAVKFQDIDSSKITKIGVGKFSGYLKGQPVFRIEHTRDTAIAVKKFGQVRLDDSYGMNDNDTYIVEVEEEYKFDCLVGLLQSLKVKPGHARLEVALHNYPDKSDSFKKQLAAVVGKFSEIRCQSEPIPCSTLVRISSKPVPASTSVSVCPVEEPATPPKPSLKSKSLIVVLDYVVPKDVYYNSGAFHVLFVTPSERASMAEKFPELTALGFVHFHGVRYPLNEDDEAGPSNEEEALVDPVNNE